MGKSRALWLVALPLLLLTLSSGVVAQAASAPGNDSRIAKLEQQVADAKSSADNCSG